MQGGMQVERYEVCKQNVSNSSPEPLTGERRPPHQKKLLGTQEASLIEIKNRSDLDGLPTRARAVPALANSI